MEPRIPKRGYVAIEIIQTKKRLASSLKALLNGNSMIKEILYVNSIMKANKKNNHFNLSKKLLRKSVFVKNNCGAKAPQNMKNITRRVKPP